MRRIYTEENNVVNKRNVLFFIAVFIFMGTPYMVHAEDFGPEEWHQYRMQGDKNAVFHNGSDPLTSRTYQTSGEVRATPVIVGNKLFIGNHESGDLHAFDVQSGKQLWEKQAPNWIHSEMIYHHGKVYVGFGNRFFRDDGIRGTGENGVMALDTETGDILWKYNTDGEVMPTPAYHDGAIYIATGDQHLFKLDPDTGAVLHHAYIGSTISMSAPNITEDTLYVGGGAPNTYTFSAYDLEKDDFKWQTEMPEVYAGLDDVPPATSDDLVVTTALEKSDDGENPEHFLYAMDTESGEIIWKESLGVGEMVSNNKSGAPMIYEGTIYIGSPIAKAFFAYDLKTGKKLWEFEDEVIKAPPVAQDGIVYFSNAKGFVYALDAKTGEELGEKELGGVLAPAGPIIMNDTLFVSSQDSNVYAVPLTDFVQEQGDKSDIYADEKHHDSSKKDSHPIQYVVLGVLILLLAVVVYMMMQKRRRY
jgi:outer membrane protein assembly factor BamB